MTRSTLLGLLCLGVMLGCSDSTDGGANSQTHWLERCSSDSACGALSCMCGVCAAPCSSEGCAHVTGRTTECLPADAAAARALCGGDAPEPLCLEPCDGACGRGQRCEAGACIPDPLPEAGSGGTGGATGSGGSGASGGSGGSGGSAGEAGASGEGGSGGVSADAGVDAGGGPVMGPVDCAGTAPKTFPSFDQSCDTIADCTLVTRGLSCCGTLLVTAVRDSEATAFEAAAAECNMQLFACGCAQGPSQADDGTMASAEHPYASVDCVSNVCTTSFKAPAITPCGPSANCNSESEICMMREPVGPAIVFECQPIPAFCFERRDCNCAAATLCTGGYDVCVDQGPNTIDCTCPTCQ